MAEKIKGMNFSQMKRRLSEFSRRTHQQVLERLGRAEASDDSEYLSRKQNVSELHEHVRKLYSQMVKYLDSVRGRNLIYPLLEALTVIL